MALRCKKIADGRKLSVWEIVIDQTSEVAKLYQTLLEKEKRTLTAKINSIAENGVPKNIEKFRHEGDGIFAIKQNQIRIYCFFDHDKMIVLTHGFIKKSQKADPKQLNKAVRIREKYNAKNWAIVSDSANCKNGG